MRCSTLAFASPRTSSSATRTGISCSSSFRDVIGEPSNAIVVLYRKHGFTRSDMVEYMQLPFWQEIQTRHPDLFGGSADVGGWGRHAGPGLLVKNRWNPALTVVSLAPVDFDGDEGRALLAAMDAQSCRDFELVAECPRAPAATVPVRRLPPGLVAGSVPRLQEAIALSRGRYLLATRSILSLLSDPTTVERLLRGFWIDSSHPRPDRRGQQRHRTAPGSRHRLRLTGGGKTAPTTWWP